MVLIYVTATFATMLQTLLRADEDQVDLRGVTGGILILIDLINETPPPTVKRVAISRNMLKNLQESIKLNEYTVVV